MDPLSIAASIAGLTVVTVQVLSLLKGFSDGGKEAPSSAQAIIKEVNGIRICLDQLHGYLLEKQETPKSRRSLIMIEQVIVVFTDCVTTFSELEQTLEMLRTDQPMGILDRLKWTMKEATIGRILQHLQTSKSSLTLMLTTLTCTSMDGALTSTRNLNTLIRRVLNNSIDMSDRLRRFERMHPTFAASAASSCGNASISECKDQRATSPAVLGFVFEEDLRTSRVYRRVTRNESRLSKISSLNSHGYTSLSWLSLSNVSDISAISLPISSMELWNHHRYSSEQKITTNQPPCSLEAWYDPPSMQTAFIRTAYFNGQYTNQYAQTKFSGHLTYRRFTVTQAHCSPIFTEGAKLAQIHEEPITGIGKEPLKDHNSDLHDTQVECSERNSNKSLSTDLGSGDTSARKNSWGERSAVIDKENALSWRWMVLKTLNEISY